MGIYLAATIFMITRIIGTERRSRSIPQMVNVLAEESPLPGCRASDGLNSRLCHGLKSPVHYISSSFMTRQGCDTRLGR